MNMILSLILTTTGIYLVMYGMRLAGIAVLTFRSVKVQLYAKIKSAYDSLQKAYNKGGLAAVYETAIFQRAWQNSMIDEDNMEVLLRLSSPKYCELKSVPKADVLEGIILESKTVFLKYLTLSMETYMFRLNPRLRTRRNLGIVKKNRKLLRQLQKERKEALKDCKPLKVTLAI